MGPEDRCLQSAKEKLMRVERPGAELTRSADGRGQELDREVRKLEPLRLERHLKEKKKESFPTLVLRPAARQEN